MTFQDYINNIPAAGNNPSDDQPNMEQNTNAIPAVFSVDHHAFLDPLGGYHLITHQDPAALGTPSGPITWTQSTRTPSTPIANISSPPINQLMTMLVTTQTAATSTDTQLFNFTANGGWSQLTGALTGANSSDGYCWAGGILIQWGKTINITSGSFASGTAQGNVTFLNRVSGAIAFPQRCFVVLTTPFYTGSSSGNLPSSESTVFVQSDSVSATGFNWLYQGSSRVTGFYFVAIGQ
jgi:hypothetical protein